jgi:hypothetical protein
VPKKTQNAAGVVDASAYGVARPTAGTKSPYQKTKNVVARLTDMESETQDVVARNSRCYYKKLF